MVVTGDRRWANFLLKNLILCLLSNAPEFAVGEWRYLKNEKVVQESDRKTWQATDANVGPFELPNADYQNWINYLQSKREIVRKRIRDIENRPMLTGFANPSLISQEIQGKIPEGDNKKWEVSTSESPLTKTITDDFPTIKHHLELLRNWSAYLEEATFNEEAALETIDLVMTTLNGNAHYTNPLELSRLNRLLEEGLKGRKVGKPPRKESLRGRDEDTLREIQRRLSEAFLYRNITLAEIKQMSKIVDFVERYRGSLRRGPDQRQGGSSG